MKFYILATISSQFAYLSHCVDAALDSIYYCTVQTEVICSLF